MLNEYQKGKEEILKQDALKKQLKLQEMKKQFVLWKKSLRN